MSDETGSRPYVTLYKIGSVANGRMLSLHYLSHTINRGTLTVGTLIRPSVFLVGPFKLDVT